MRRGDRRVCQRLRSQSVLPLSRQSRPYGVSLSLSLLPLFLSISPFPISVSPSRCFTTCLLLSFFPSGNRKFEGEATELTLLSSNVYQGQSSLQCTNQQVGVFWPGPLKFTFLNPVFTDHAIRAFLPAARNEHAGLHVHWAQLEEKEEEVWRGTFCE